MLPPISPLTALQNAIADGLSPAAIAQDCAAKADANASRNTYLDFDPDALAARAETLAPGGALYGVPLSLKDLFDLAGTKTTAGTRFYADLNPAAHTDSAVAKALKQSGALIIGKTHLHPLAYGLTGENPDFGDCLQPRDATLLTGGSSSGAVASVQEGSALAAIGTDTGGSVRIPAALCGLVGYRASHALPNLWPELWQGGVHLAPSFDTIGLFTRDPRDVAPLASALFRLPGAPSQPVSPFQAGFRSPRIGCVSLDFCADANAEVLAAYAAWKQHLQQTGATLVDFDPIGWNAATDIYAPIQAHEAFTIHRRYLDALEPTLETRIAERLRWGASLTGHDLESLRSRHMHFRAAIAALLAQFDFLMLPVAPVNRLVAGDDFTLARPAILRYTTPFSLGGLPTVTLPGELIGAPTGTGVQLAAPQLEDSVLLAYIATL
jgi:Asp-tRNA(Asn)/Glu-tRNA(Gln) amidotransferase A subunit family amidase